VINRIQKHPPENTRLHDEVRSTLACWSSSERLLKYIRWHSSKFGVNVGIGGNGFKLLIWGIFDSLVKSQDFPCAWGHLSERVPKVIFRPFQSI